MNITEKIKAYISRFQAWQRNPIKYENRNPSTVICANCGHEITENFCPLCGQKATIGRIRWKTIRIGFMTIWGMESRSFLYSIWQLLWRPGHLISDFLNGRRQTCFPPIRMIVILGLVLALLDYLFEDETKETPQKGLSFIKTIGYWLENHPEWSFMLLCCFFIVPTWFLFRYAPRHNLQSRFRLQLVGYPMALTLLSVWRLHNLFSSIIYRNPFIHKRRTIKQTWPSWRHLGHLYPLASRGRDSSVRIIPKQKNPKTLMTNDACHPK